MFYCRQLQDTRVKVHINLFTAMLLQSLMSLTQNFFYGCKIYITILMSSRGHDQSCVSFKNIFFKTFFVTKTCFFSITQSHICRVLMTLSHYFELTIFTWLLIEGWYFYTYISRAPYKEYLTIIPHILVGWGKTTNSSFVK